MATNLEQLKLINRLALIKEIIEKSENFALIWNDIAPGKFIAVKDNYEFHLNKTSPSVVALDVLKNGNFYRSYNSSTQVEIADLFDKVSSISNLSINKFRKLQNFISDLPNCGD